jgi:uncharacterized cysteine cluster protein YcgN (CxxCxxCC family)
MHTDVGIECSDEGIETARIGQSLTQHDGRLRAHSMRHWWNKAMNKMTHAEWEALCSGCGRCCVHKHEDHETRKVTYTSVACRHMNLETCRCTCYSNRKMHAPECLDLFRCKPKVLKWMPSTCAYRMLAEGHDLPAWHPLVSGDPDSTRKAGMSVRGHV